MTSASYEEPRIVRVVDSFGVVSEDSTHPRTRGILVAGTTLAVRIEAAEGAMFGLAVGGERLAVAEWNVVGSFEVIVTSHYAPRMAVHVAVRGAKSEGSEVSEWLGPVDDYRILVYEVEADSAAGGEPTCPPA